jgi:hypothetical protein
LATHAAATLGEGKQIVRIAEATPFESLAAATLLAAVQVLHPQSRRVGPPGRWRMFGPAEQPALEAACADPEGNTQPAARSPSAGHPRRAFARG